MSRRQVEFDRSRQEREERIRQIRMARKQEREAKRKMIYYLRKEEERLNKLREEEEAQKREGVSLNFVSISLAGCVSFLSLVETTVVL